MGEKERLDTGVNRPGKARLACTQRIWVPTSTVKLKRWCFLRTSHRGASAFQSQSQATVTECRKENPSHHRGNLNLKHENTQIATLILGKHMFASMNFFYLCFHHLWRLWKSSSRSLSRPRGKVAGVAPLANPSRGRAREDRAGSWRRKRPRQTLGNRLLPRYGCNHLVEEYDAMRENPSPPGLSRGTVVREQSNVLLTQQEVGDTGRTSPRQDCPLCGAPLRSKLATGFLGLCCTII